MPRSQRNLDFKVKKSSTITRTRSKGLASKENVGVPITIAPKLDNTENVQFSLSRKNQQHIKENILSSPKRTPLSPCITSNLSLSPCDTNRIPPLGYQALSVSPRKIPSDGISSSRTQTTPRSPLSTALTNKPTPIKRRALTFSPVKDNETICSTLLSPKNAEFSTKVRSLDFSNTSTPSTDVSDEIKTLSDLPSPTKKSKIDDSVKLPIRKSSRLQSPLQQSPRVSRSSTRRNVKLLSLVKENAQTAKLLSPVRHSPHCSKLLTPVRQSPRLLISALRQGVLKTPDKRSVKKLTFADVDQVCSSAKSILLTPAKSILLTPRKPCVIPDDVRRSPRKHQSPALGLQSPSKLLQSPRQWQLLQEEVRRSPRKHNTPLRLAKQEGLCYQRAKRALNTALPKRLLCREKQYKEVNDFLDKCLDKHVPGSLYISGAPGTGKTAVLSHTLQRLKEETETQVIYLNCMSVKNSQAIFNRVLGELKGKDTSLSTKEAASQIEKSLVSKDDMVCMIMDEVDQLDSKNQEVLYTMFEWPHLKNSRLVLIGIANALDLTDRILPRLQAKPKCKPKLMNFPPYSKDQIVTIIQDRLSQVEVEGEQVLDANAIQFCARKVAAVAGDIRKALDVCRRAIEMVESEVKKQQIISTVTKSPSKRSTMSAVPKKIGVAHIMKTVNEVYGSRSAIQTNATQTIPLQQKLAVCTLLLSLKRGKSKEVPLGKLHDNYSKVCKKQEVPPVDQSEFLSLCTLIEARGIMGIKKAKETRLDKVSLKIDEGELERALQDKTLVSSVLKLGLVA